MPRSASPLAGATAAVLGALALAACGGGATSDTGILRLSLTDAPACGAEKVFVTVEKVRVHQSSAAAETDAGWREIVLASPQRVDLLTLTNGTLLPLGEAALPAGRYTQLRLVLAANSAANPLANSVVPAQGAERALTTPSAAQSGLKLNVNLEVAPDKIADFAIDFDACKSIVKAGASGQYLLKPVLSVIPLLSDAGLRIVGYLDPGLAGSSAGTTTVSVQVNGVPARATPPDATGRFVLYPVPVGTYDLVITAAGRVNAVMTGVPVTATAYTTIGTATAVLNPPAAAASSPAAAVSGTVSATPASAYAGGAVRALQTLAGGPTIEAGFANADAVTGAYGLTLPTAAPARTAYAAGATTFAFTADPTAAGKYRLEATASGFATAKTADVTLTGPQTVDFAFP